MGEAAKGPAEVSAASLASVLAEWWHMVMSVQEQMPTEPLPDCQSKQSPARLPHLLSQGSSTEQPRVLIEQAPG